MSNVYAIVLAAGQGTRMKSKKYKVLHEVCGKPMVEHVIDHLQQLQMEQPIVIVGHGADAVKDALGDRVKFVIQEEQLGTAHAVLQAASLMEGKTGTTVVIYGDTPLITMETIKKLIDKHVQTKAAATLLTATLEDATGYGRVIRLPDGSVSRVVEHKDANEEELKVSEINAGTYCFDNGLLFDALKKVDNSNKQGEYYLPDVLSILRGSGQRIEANCTEDVTETFGVNDRLALAEAQKIMQQRIVREHMKNGVTILSSDQTYIESDVVIGRDTTIYPGCVIRGKTVIGEDCTLGPQTEIRDSTLLNQVTVEHSVVYESLIEDGATIGPFAYLRPKSHIGPEVKIGDFVEIKNAKIGKGSKASHLAYVGDAEVGENVNIGCGVITVNYDGFQKHKTVIQDEAFVGSNVNLIAPVRIGKGAYVVAGSTITDDVPDDALAIARQRQTNKPDYAGKIKQRLQKKK
jgi:bifunctional UDP-N-acetylglucosamine pyrophosphorylase/glucosamine-1-phosphate N-acetyltransferase